MGGACECRHVPASICTKRIAFRRRTGREKMGKGDSCPANCFGPTAGGPGGFPLEPGASSTTLKEGRSGPRRPPPRLPTPSRRGHRPTRSPEHEQREAFDDFLAHFSAE